MIILCLTQVTQLSVYNTQAIVRICNVNIVRSKLFQTNGQCTIMIILSLTQVTQLSVYNTPAIVRTCNMNIIRSQLFRRMASARS